jgi:iron-sulfur cluster repair protein YtfE (RIC family)
MRTPVTCGVRLPRGDDRAPHGGRTAEGTEEQVDALQLLKADHDRVKKMLNDLDETTERAEKTRTELFAKLNEELTIHAKIEESIFYPAIKQEAETREIVLEGFEEHHVIKMLLKELDSMPVDTEQWAAKLKVLKENVEHHVEEEEQEMFQKSREVLSEDEINQLGARMEEMKEQLKSQVKSAGA